MTVTGRSALGLGAALACLVASCGDEAVRTPSPPTVSCETRIWARSRAGAAPRVVGDFTDERPVAMTPAADGWFTWVGELSPGEHEYALDEAGTRAPDPTRPLTVFHGDEERTLLSVPDCGRPSLVVDEVRSTAAGLELRARFLSAGRAPASVAAAEAPPGFDVTTHADTGEVIAVERAPRPGKRRVALSARDAGGRSATAEVSVLVGARHERWSDAIVVQVLTDRLRGPDGSALAPPKTPGRRAGGTLDGVRLALPSLEALGATALWLSPVYENPTGLFEGRDGRAYEGYHGYWPKRSRGVDPAIGGERALHDLVDAAHARGLSVLADLVPNHVHEQNPRYSALPDRDDAFHVADGCVCGSPGCDWGARILDCWFTPYLPDVRLEAPREMRAARDEAVFWMRTFDLDGARVDAVPMMPRGAVRYLARGLRDDAGERNQTLVMGEVFTGPGAGGVENIRYYLGPDTLDSAFDFPLMWATRDALAGRAGLADVEAVLVEEERRWAGSGTLPARILGNHDTPRFASALAGDGDGDPWLAPAAQSEDADLLARVALGHALILTLPGIPVLFQGDEVALAGSGDPDNRRVMPPDDALSPARLALRGRVSALAKLRACSRALRRGDRRPLVSGARTLAYSRRDGDDEAIVLLSNEVTASSVSLSREGKVRDALTGEEFSLPGAVPMPRLSARVLLRDADPCGVPSP